jgi:hypothetical protein
MMQIKRQIRGVWVVVALVAAGCSQNIDTVSNGERLEDSTVPERIGGNPLLFTEAEMAERESEGGMDDEVPPFVKAFFMHTWVEALYGPPANNNPNPTWSSPLLDPVNNRVWCTDCHVSGQVNFENIPKQRLPMTAEYENDHEFMADLMRKWVARLNSDEYFASAKLARPVDCLTCHETHPDPQ